MGSPGDAVAIDAVIARLANRQSGVVAAWQLSRERIGRKAIQLRLDGERLHPVFDHHPGVYTAGHKVIGPHGRLWAAVLACGEGAAISHTHACWLWRVVEHAPAQIHVTAPTHRRHSHEIATHRNRLDDQVRTTRFGIPTTTLDRALLDYADLSSQREIERALERAEMHHDLDVTALAPMRGRRGGRKLRRAIAEIADGCGLTESELEDRFEDIVREQGLPRPVRQMEIGPYRVDFCWPELQLVVESTAGVCIALGNGSTATGCATGICVAAASGWSGSPGATSRATVGPPGVRSAP